MFTATNPEVTRQLVLDVLSNSPGAADILRDWLMDTEDPRAELVERVMAFYSGYHPLRIDHGRKWFWANDSEDIDLATSELPIRSKYPLLAGIEDQRHWIIPKNVYGLLSRGRPEQGGAMYESTLLAKHDLLLALFLLAGFEVK
jgi:hypothetical protein